MNELWGEEGGNFHYFSEEKKKSTAGAKGERRSEP